MKLNKIILLILIALVAGLQNCDTPTEPDPEITSSKGDAIIVNSSILREAGITEIYINETDTIPLNFRTIFGATGEYTLASEDAGVVKVNNDSLWVIALGDSGVSTVITVTDIANDIVKEIPIHITRGWADPLYYEYLGSFENHLYYISTHADLWTVAYEYCDREMSDGYLFVMNSFEEYVAVTKMLNHQPLWVGLAEYFNNLGVVHDDWTWITGDSIKPALEDKRLKGLFNFVQASFENRPFYRITTNYEFDRTNEQEQLNWLLEIEK